MLLEGRNFGRPGASFPPYFHYEVVTGVMSINEETIKGKAHWQWKEN